MKINELNELTTAEMIEKEKQFKEEGSSQVDCTHQDSVASKRIKQVRIRRRRLIAHE